MSKKVDSPLVLLLFFFSPVQHMYVAEYFRFISNSGQIDIRLQIHEKKKKKQKTDKPINQPIYFDILL